MTIIFYDIPSKLAVKSGRPTLESRLRLALNIKGLPYQTVWVEFPNIDRVCKDIGAKPTDSLEIARYLDNQYPETIAMFPKGSQALQAAFKEAMSASPWPTFSLRRMNAPSEHSTFEEEEDPKGEARDEQWAKMREGHEIIAAWFLKSEESQFVMGKDVSFADTMLVAWLRVVGVAYGEESDEWKAVLALQDGWWARDLKQFDQYLAGV
ncbi:hypothetical protein FIBSPDRAFT_919171 [Athelia psychrophila]|uniref:Glutathione S-transferase UstS-like C-terminal domain-containing protein n=1 Tax=Athelia psychrophila TaxID=1759441 RepID=A0A166LWL6_9AGAM|nr:hypothetical protein FIBSPDRAFT_919171 [Fibularhizoctonia sp. CBS 109695]